MLANLETSTCGSLLVSGALPLTSVINLRNDKSNSFSSSGTITVNVVFSLFTLNLISLPLTVVLAVSITNVRPSNFVPTLTLISPLYNLYLAGALVSLIV